MEFLQIRAKSKYQPCRYQKSLSRFLSIALAIALNLLPSERCYPFLFPVLYLFRLEWLLADSVEPELLLFLALFLWLAGQGMSGWPAYN